MSKFLDSNGVLYFWQKIKAAFVQKVEGKGLSTEDFTSEEKAKLAGLENYTLPMATDSTIGGIKVKHKDHINDNPIPDGSEIIFLNANADSVGYVIVPSATTEKRGFVKIGEGLSVSDEGLLTLAPADKGVLGGIKVSTKDDPGVESLYPGSVEVTLRSSENGVGYVRIGPATKTRSGVVSIGNGLVISDEGIVSVGNISWDSITDKPDLTNVYNYKGSVANVANLPTTGNTKGDVWNVESSDMNYAWTGEAWDPLGGSFSVEVITNAEIDAIVAG